MTVLLAQVLEDLLLERPLKKITSDHYRLVVREYSAFLKRPAAQADLNHRSVNEWLRSLEGKLAPKTIRGRWLGMSSVWNYAAEIYGIDPPHPRRVRRVKIPAPNPTIWMEDEAASLVAAARRLKGRIKGIDAAHLITAFVLVDYFTGLRRSDVLMLRFDQIGLDNGCRSMQSKTLQPTIHWLDPVAMAAVDKIRLPHRELIFPFRKSCLGRWWKKLLIEAGLPIGRREGPQKLRRTSATAVAVEHGMDAAEQHLGHKTRGLAAKHYVPQWALQKKRMPPPLADSA